MTEKLRVGNEHLTPEELEQNMEKIAEIINQPGSVPAAIISGKIPASVAEDFLKIFGETTKETGSGSDTS